MNDGIEFVVTDIYAIWVEAMITVIDLTWVEIVIVFLGQEALSLKWILGN